MRLPLEPGVWQLILAATPQKMACLPFSISDLVSISSGYPYPDFSSSGRKKVSKEVVPKKVEDKVSKVWVWRPKCGSSRWQRFYVVMEEAELKTFKDDKVRVFQIQHCMSDVHG